MIPSILLKIFVGSTLSDLADVAEGGNMQHSTLSLVMLVSGLALGVLAVAYLTLVTKRYLHQNRIDLENATFLAGEN